LKVPNIEENKDLELSGKKSKKAKKKRTDD
jgi:hypothetical protein